MAEKKTNDFATTLTAGVNASATTISVASAAPAGLQSGEFRIRIDNEILKVTSGQSTTSWTVERAAEGPNGAATHLVDAAVRHIVSSASFDLLVQQQIDASGLATDAELATHAALTEGVHGLPNAAAGEAIRRNPGDTGWEAFDPATQAELNTHEADKTNVHGFANTDLVPRLTAAPVAGDDEKVVTYDNDVLGYVLKAVAGTGASAKFEAVTLGATPALDVASKTIAVFEGTLSANSVATTSNRPDGSLIFLLGRQATTGGPYTLSIDGTSVGVPTTAGEYFLVMMVAGDVDTYGGLIGLKLPLAQTDITNLVTDLAAKALASDLTAHLNDTSDAHDASAISILDTANDFTATDVEAALAELQTADEADEAALAAHLADTSDAHDASAVSFVPTGTIAATDVQAAIAEVASEAGGGASYPSGLELAKAHGMVSVPYDPTVISANFSLTAGQVALVRLLDFPQTSLTTFWANVGQAGTGGSPANWFGGLYYVSGANLVLAAKTADQVSNWNATGGRSAALTAESGQSLTRGGASDQVYIAFLAGTQSSTAVAIGRGAAASNNMNVGLVAGTDPLRSATFGSGLSALPATIAISSLAAAQAPWGGVE